MRNETIEIDETRPGPVAEPCTDGSRAQRHLDAGRERFDPLPDVELAVSVRSSLRRGPGDDPEALA